MPLSEREQQMLDQMERALYEEDPRFASTLGNPGNRARRLRWTLGGIGVLLGLGLVVLGISTEIWVGVAGFAVMVGAAAYALSPPRRTLRPVETDGTLGPAARPGAARSAGRGSSSRERGASTFMQRMERRWERRQERDRGW